jgi:hypothetical protein
MCESCLWCKSTNADRLIQTTEGWQPICKCCHRALRKRSKPRRTRHNPQAVLRHALFPFMTDNKNGSVLGDNIRAGRN